MSTVITERPLYQRPNRPLAIEAAIIAALAQGPISAHLIANFVQRHLPWAGRFEITEARERMIHAQRMCVVPQEGRAIPLFALPEVAHAAHDATPPAARDLAPFLPA